MNAPNTQRLPDPIQFAALFAEVMIGDFIVGPAAATVPVTLTHSPSLISAIGMVFAARLAVSRGLAGEDLAQRTVRVLSSLGLETEGPLPPAHDILRAFQMDKKFHGGVRFVLLRSVGEPVVVEGVTDEGMKTVLEEMGAPA